MFPAVFTCTGAWAEAVNEEVVRYPSLLSFGEVNQSVGVSYAYAGHKSRAGYDTSQDLAENYGIATRAAVLNPDVLLLQLSGGISFQQQLGNSSSKLFDYDYNIIGSAFQLTYHPMLLSASRNSSTVSSGYLPSYTTERTNYRVSASLLNSVLPVRLYFLHSTSQTTGLAADFSGTSDAAGIGIHHQLGSISSTDATLSFSTSTTGAIEGRSYTGFLLNRSELDAAKRYHLITKGSVTDSVNDGAPSRQADLSLSLSGSPGEALTVGLSGQTSYNSSQSFEGVRQLVKTNTLEGSIGHRLYQSLTTTLSGSVGQSKALGGSENNYDAKAQFAYQKRLPADSLLSVNVNFGHTVTKQDFQDSLLSATDEAHQVGQQGDQIAMNLAGKLTIKRVERRDVNGIVDFVYAEGTDYRVDPVSNKLEIIVNGQIAPGTTIYVSYEVGVNKNIDFTTDLQSYLASVTLFGGRYIITSDYVVNSQKQISGTADVAALTDYTAFTLKGSAHYQETNMGVEYGTISGTHENLSRLSAFWNRDTHITSSDSLRLNFVDTYTMYDATATSKAYDINVASAVASYNRSIFGGVRMQVSGNLSDSRRSGGASSDMATLRLGLDGNYNQIVVSMSAQTSYRMASGSNSRDDSLQFKITRYF